MTDLSQELQRIRIVMPSGGWKSDASLAEEYQVASWDPSAAYARAISELQFYKFHQNAMSDDELYNHFCDTLIQANILVNFRGWQSVDSLIPPHKDFFRVFPAIPSNANHLKQRVFAERGLLMYLEARACTALETNLRNSPILRQAGLAFMRMRLAEESGHMETDMDKIKEAERWKHYLAIGLQRFVLLLDQGLSIHDLENVLASTPLIDADGPRVPAQNDLDRMNEAFYASSSPDSHNSVVTELMALVYEIKSVLESIIAPEALLVDAPQKDIIRHIRERLLALATDLNINVGRLRDDDYHPDPKDVLPLLSLAPLVLECMQYQDDLRRANASLTSYAVYTQIRDIRHDYECPVCYVGERDHDPWVTLHCRNNHIVHQSCIDNWRAQGHTTCCGGCLNELWDTATRGAIIHQVVRIVDGQPMIDRLVWIGVTQNILIAILRMLDLTMNGPMGPQCFHFAILVVILICTILYTVIDRQL